MPRKPSYPFADLSNDPEAIYDPHESDCIQAWDDRTTENQAKCLKVFREVVKRTNIRYVIQLNLRGPSVDGIYPKRLYPLEFNTAADAWDYARLSSDPDIRAPDVRGWSVETIRKPRPKIHEPRVRRTNLKEEPRAR